MTERVRVEVPGFVRDVEIGDGERLCPTCDGRAVAYGRYQGGAMLVGADAEGAWLRACADCHDGVQRQCPYCGTWQAAPRICRCCGRLDADAARAWAAERARIEAAIRLTVEEAVAAGVVYVSFPEDDECVLNDVAAVADWADDYSSGWGRNRPTLAWVMRPHKPSLDAADIVYQMVDEDADAAADLEGETAELQSLLDGWIAAHRDRLTLWEPDYTRAVSVPPSDTAEEAGEAEEAGRHVC